MIHSMTGFGRAEKRILDREVTVEIRSVNNRFKDVIVRMPRNFAALEGDVKKIISDGVSRGRLEVSLQVDDSTEREQNLKLNLDLAARYFQLLKEMKEALDLPGEIAISHMTGLRDIIAYEEQPLDLEPFFEQVKVLVQEALDKMLQMRQTEGKAIATDFGRRLESMKRWADQILSRREVVTAETRTRLETKIQAYAESVELDQARLAQEVAYIIERGDITEEIVRFNSHVDQFMTLMSKDGPVGRKMEFLLQEMNREVNTIGSKSSDLDISNLVLDLKTELEKLREQVLNVE